MRTSSRLDSPLRKLFVRKEQEVDYRPCVFTEKAQAPLDYDTGECHEETNTTPSASW